MKALVTAGSRGIGAGIVKVLEDAGHDVAIISRTKGYKYDLLRGVEFAIEHVIDDFGFPDILVHNLGGTLGITDPYAAGDDWERVFRLNLGVAIDLNRAFVPNMQRKCWGRVVHISSVSALENQGTVQYCAAKAALNAYVRSFGRYVAKDGVSVSAVMPGAVFTDGGYWDHPRAESFVKERMAIGRLGKVEEIASLVAWLCSPESSFVAGSSFLIDGGQGRAFEQAA